MSKYKLPTMVEINAQQQNGYNVISLFSGCGGSSLGYKMAGFNVRGALEFVEQARETYAVNFPNTPIMFKDIRETSGKELLEMAGLTELDVLDGSPPCSPFSMAGKREKHWGQVVNYSNTQQRTDDLFDEYIRMVKEIRPKVCVAENVKGIIIGNAKDYYMSIIQRIRDLGYNVDYRLLDSKDYGVPQSRERVFLIGVRRDIGSPIFPQPFGYEVSTKDAIEDLMDNGTDQVEISKRMDNLKYFPSGVGRNEAKKIADSIGLTFYGMHYARDRWDKPFYTIIQNHTRPLHPIVDRVLSIDEGKRLQSFPNDFKLIHSPNRNWERIGRAVPPLLMKSIAGAVLDILKCSELFKD